MSDHLSEHWLGDFDESYITQFDLSKRFAQSWMYNLSNSHVLVCIIRPIN